MMECAHKVRNAAMCNCTYGGCPRHGICCECLAYHRSAGELPACYFDKKTEKTYDRSLGAYVRMRNGGR